MRFTTLVRARTALQGRFTMAHASASLSTLMREPTVVGLPKDDDPRSTLKGLYKDMLAAISELPETAAYRRNVQTIAEYRLGVVESEEEIKVIEDRLGVGYIEEVIEQAQDELELIPHMKKWAPWESKDGSTPTKVNIEVLD